MARMHQAIAIVSTLAAQLCVGLPPPDQRVDFSEHGSDWSQGQCSSRLYQSPIDLDAMFKPPNGYFNFFYNDVHSQNITLANDGRSISIETVGEGFGGVGMQMAGGGWYNLKRIQIKARSEHTFRGKHMPLEVQLVHQQSNIADPTVGPQDVTVSVLVNSANPPVEKEKYPGLLQTQEKPVEPKSLLQKSRHHSIQKHKAGTSQEPDDADDEAESPAPPPYVAPAAGEANFNSVMQFFVEQEPPVFDTTVDVALSQANPLNLGSLLRGGTFFMYRGSGTEPPCTENVIWLVRREEVMASDAQISALSTALYKMSNGFGNYRTVMPLNQRDVSIWTGQEQEPLAKPLTTMPPVGPPAGVDDGRDSKFIPLAQDAITIAKAAGDYAKDMDQRMMRSSQAYLTDLRASAATTFPPPTLPPVLVPKPPLDKPWAMSKITQAIKKQISDAVNRELAEVGPAAANLARSYLRQGILNKAGFTLPPTTPPPTTTGVPSFQPLPGFTVGGR